MTTTDREIIRLLREASAEALPALLDMLTCYAYCNDEFYREMEEARTKGKEAMLACVAKWKATIPEELHVIKTKGAAV